MWVFFRRICWGCTLSSQIKELGALGTWTQSTSNHPGTSETAPAQRGLLSAEQALLGSQSLDPQHRSHDVMTAQLWAHQGLWPLSSLSPGTQQEQ